MNNNPRLHDGETPLQNCPRCGKCVVSLDGLGVPIFRTRMMKVTATGGELSCRFCKGRVLVPVVLSKTIADLVRDGAGLARPVPVVSSPPPEEVASGALA